jgi:hypothetical protein
MLSSVYWTDTFLAGFTARLHSIIREETLRLQYVLKPQSGKTSWTPRLKPYSIGQKTNRVSR